MVRLCIRKRSSPEGLSVPPPTQPSPINGLQSQQGPRACLKCPRSVHCCSGFWFQSKSCACHSCNLVSVAPPATSKFSPCWTSPSFTRSASQGLVVARLSVAFLLTETKRNAHNLSLFGCTSARFRRDFILPIRLPTPLPCPSSWWRSSDRPGPPCLICSPSNSTASYSQILPDQALPTISFAQEKEL